MKPLSFSAFFLLVLTGTVVQADAGKFQFVYGDVAVTHADGSRTVPRKGDRLDEGDVVATGAMAQTQLVMNDGGLIAMRPDSRMRIEVFRFTGKADGSEQGVFGLLKGGFRAITGLIGRVNKDNYKIRTATATIGIRGTDHEALYIAPPAPGETPIGPPGTYDKVNVGKTYLETPSGRLELAGNQVGFVPAAVNAAPVRLPSIPDFLKSTPGIRPGRGGSGADSPSGAAATGNTPEGTPTGDAPTTATTTSDNPATATTTTASADTATVMAAPSTALIAPSPTGVFNPANALTAPAGTVIAGGGIGSAGPNNGAGIIGDASSKLSAILDASGAVLIVNADKFSYNRNGAPAIMTDSTTVGAEKVNWGVYDGGTMIDNGITSTKTTFFWMDSTSASTSANLATALTANSMTFSTVGGFTKPITEGGSVGGTVTASSITLANVSSVPSVTAYSLSVTDALGRSWTGNLTGTQSLSAFQTGSTNNLSVTCGGGTCGTSTGTGNVQGVPIGNPTPVGMISSYKMQGAGSTALVGAVLTR
jgi:hypothetical protein